VEKLFSLQGNCDKPDSLLLIRYRADPQSPRPGFGASKIRNFNRIRATKRAARKKISPKVKTALSQRPPAARWQNRNSPDTGRTLSFDIRCNCGTGPGQPVPPIGKVGSTVGTRTRSIPVTSGSAPGDLVQPASGKGKGRPAPTKQGPDKPEQKGRRPIQALMQRRDRW
jgi:hypothetical protein